MARHHPKCITHRIEMHPTHREHLLPTKVERLQTNQKMARGEENAHRLNHRNRRAAERRSKKNTKAAIRIVSLNIKGCKAKDGTTV
jgi:hypothetical protein